MRLPKPFFRLPVRFDVERMRTEVAALPPGAWAKHPNEIEGNSSVRLISVGGAENDDVDGAMAPTPHLRQAPYLRQILASFGVVWSRSRLMRLDPHSNVPEHADINHHWFSRVRLHIPVVTRPEVKFHCGGQTVHMAAGEAWLFDNWRLHRVENPTDDIRIHFVADTSGSAAFWQYVAQSESPNVTVRELRFDPSRDERPLTERTPPPLVMPPAEVDLLCLDLRGELTAREETAESRAQLARYHRLLDAFCRDWRQLYLLHGENSGWRQFGAMLETMREASRQQGEGLVARTNGVAAHTVLEARLLRHLLHLPARAAAASSQGTSTPSATPVEQSRLKSPLFIVAAPRSGSTLLFETLAVSPQLHTLGGEAHWLIEGSEELRPGAPGVDSNRLDAGHATGPIAQRIIDRVLRNLQDSQGQPAKAGPDPIRLLEKTPKNALRIPFFDAVFPDARFILLWRDPRENLASIIEAWRSGSWMTYGELPDWEGPWSLLLPPGWQSLRGQPLEEVAAFQWECANRIALDDLGRVAPGRWTCVRYSDLVERAGETISRICAFAGIAFDAALVERTAAQLPLSRYTQSPPAAEKWRAHEDAIQRVLAKVEATWQRLREKGSDLFSAAHDSENRSDPISR
ncbi:MAG TPA: sulfotransferase [Steroidobacteraceae bacterium]|nr:sulfotransferase [Steroidobacteraceae bacterium]